MPNARTFRRDLALALLLTTAALVVCWLALRATGRLLVSSSQSGAEIVVEAAPPRSPAEDQVDPSTPRNLVIFIADGMGFSHLSLAKAVLHGINGTAQWDRFEATGWQSTHSAKWLLTDSAAAATSLATGLPTYPGGIGVDLGKEPQPSLFEQATKLGYQTAIVTDSYVWDATPASFVTHHPQRSDDAAANLLGQLGESQLDVLVGELEDVGEGSIPDWEASVALFKQRFQVLGPEVDDALYSTLETHPSPIALLFEEDQITNLESVPALPQLASATLRRLSTRPQPFMLLVEVEEIDSAAHDGDLDRLIEGFEVIEATLAVLLDFAERDEETLVVFTADHETGGLAFVAAATREQRARVIWATSDHTASVVPVFASGPHAASFVGSRTNWELGRLLAQQLGSAAAASQLQPTDPEEP